MDGNDYRLGMSILLRLGDIMGPDEYEFHCRRHSRRHAEAFGMLPEWRRARREIRAKERARRAELKKVALGGAQVAQVFGDGERHLRHPNGAKRKKH